MYRLLYYSRFVLRWNERGEVEGAIQDFGVACQVGARGTPLSLAGNATYRPPEYRSLVERANPKQEDIAAVTTPAMDVFAMGKILTKESLVVIEILLAKGRKTPSNPFVIGWSVKVETTGK